MTMLDESVLLDLFGNRILGHGLRPPHG